MKVSSKSALVTVTLLMGQLYADPSEERQPPKTPHGMQLRATELKLQVDVDLQHVERLQAKARKEKDVIKLSCINDKLIELKPEANMFDAIRKELLDQFDEAIAQSLEKSAIQVHKIREQADMCAGEFELAPGASGNSVTAPEISDDPTTDLPFDMGTLVEPPAYASPWN
jgi:hypothetical protein